MRMIYLQRGLVRLLALCLAIAGLGTGAQVTATRASATAAAQQIQVQSPVFGPWGGSEGWYNATGSSMHKAFATFDDTNAYDLNLPRDIDNGLPVYAPSSGKVTSLGTTYPGTLAGGSLGAVLIDHENGYFTGFMHLRDIKVQSGDRVTTNTIIGYISNTGVSAKHLHFAYYAKIKKNGKDYLSSVKVGFTARDFNLSLPISINLRRNNTYQISAAVPFPGISSKIEDTAWYNSTYWTSSSSGIAKVSGSGKVTAVAAGSATITLRFSGKVFNIPVKVTN